MVATADGRCPACGRALSAAKAAPPPPPPRPPRHPLVLIICLLLMASGFWRFFHRPVQTLDLVVVDLGLIWLGAIGLVLLQFKRALDKRRRPS
jgi:hypothetical protein